MHFSKLGNQLHQVRFNFEHGRRGSLFQGGGGKRSISPSTCTDCEGTDMGGRYNLVLLFVNLDYFGKFTSCNIGIIVMFCMIFNNPVLL